MKNVLSSRCEAQRLEIRSSLFELQKFTEFVDRFCQEAHVVNEDRVALQVTLEEVAINLILHGYNSTPDHVFVVSMQADQRSVTAIIVDDAPRFDPLASPELDTTVPGEDPDGECNANVTRLRLPH